MNLKSSTRLGRTPAFLRLLKWLSVVVGVISGAGLLIALYLSLPPRGGALVKLSVRPGESARQVASTLQESSLIRSALLFRLVLTQMGRGSDIKAGDYQFTTGVSMRAIAHQLTTGQGSRTNIMVTIPEGFTTEEIASELEAHGICSAKAFLNAEQTAPLAQPIVTQIVHLQRGTKFRLEGMLFPDTYAFYAGESPRAVLHQMLDNFGEHVEPLQPSWTKQGKSARQIITVASMIEREAKVDSERPLIASVIYNRLRIGMALQIDATISYMLGKDTRLTEGDLEHQGAYNTYLHTGLPAGPISNPGMASILAALHPKVSPYLYYVVKNNGSGEDYFATTYKDQRRNIARSMENLRHYASKHS